MMKRTNTFPGTTEPLCEKHRLTKVAYDNR
jgi:hypothetical protein